MKKKPTKVLRYDGQSIWTSDSSYSSYSDYELGSFLGGGAAGVVYEAECFKTKRHLAVKVLNPIGYKLAPSGSLRFCEVVVKGLPYGDVGGTFGGTRVSRGGHQGHGVSSSGGGSGGAGKMSEKHVWWLVNASTRQTIAAYYDARTGMLKEMTLPKCIEVWGLGDDKGRRAGERGGRAGRDRGKRDRDRDRIRPEDRLERVFIGGEWLTIPTAPVKYDKFLRARASIFREISNMLQLSEHPNILRLHEALELVQDSKATIFLVLELARGGELFDRIKVDCGADEGAARHYFRQLLSGVRHCHDRGVCHRDLKPENLLLADPDDASVLKIADFGFSALFRELESESSSGDDSSGSSATGGKVRSSRAFPPNVAGRARAAGVGGVAGGAGAGGAGGGTVKGLGRGVRRLTSVVGSPYYVAPEVLREESGQGYDGTKADVWSMGVILYAMLAGNLPFEKELLTCPRFAKFGAWARQPAATASLRAHCSGHPKDAMNMDCLDYPSWFFPQHFSFASRSLLAGLLHPDASSRLSVRQALRHPWVLDGGLYQGSSGSGGSSSDGSDFAIGAAPSSAAGRDDVDFPASSRADPDPQDIPSELLGNDSDTDEELELSGHFERKDGRDDYCHRGGGVHAGIARTMGLGRAGSRPGPTRGVVHTRSHTVTSQSLTSNISSQPLSSSVTTAAVVPTAREMPSATAVVVGVLAEKRGVEDGGGVSRKSIETQTGAENASLVTDETATAVPATRVSGEEEKLRDSGASGGGKYRREAEASSRSGCTGDSNSPQQRDTSVPGPAPPPVPSVAASVRSSSPGESVGARETDVDILAGRMDRLSLLRAAAAAASAAAAAGGGNDGVVGAAAEVVRVLSSGQGSGSMRKRKSPAVSENAGADGVRRTTGEGGASSSAASSSVDVAAEAAEEEALAAREAAANKAAMAAVGLPANPANRIDLPAEPQPPPPSSPSQAAPPMTGAGNSAISRAPLRSGGGGGSAGGGGGPRGVTPGGGRRSRPLDAFSSPPLAPIGVGHAVDESDFSLESACPPLPPEKGRARSSSGRDGLPPSGAGYSSRSAAGGGGGGGGGLRPLSTGDRPLTLGVAGMAMEEGARREGGVVAVAPPAFHDLVKRSTRFMTSVPAAVVLRKIATIINSDAHPLPYPYRNIKQKAVVHQDEYKLEIMRGGVLVCTVQIYLLGGEHRAAQYMVEFLRGQLDIFLFKRFYENVRCKLNDLVKKDYSLALLESGTCTHRFRRFSNLA